MFDDDGMIYIAKGVLWNNSLWRLDISSNKYCTDWSLGKIAKGLSKNKIIYYLNMSYNDIGTITL